VFISGIVATRELPTQKPRSAARSFDIGPAYEEGVARLAVAVEVAARGERGLADRVSAGLWAGLDLLAADPSLARLLLVESLAPPPSVRSRCERAQTRWAQALVPLCSEAGNEVVAAERARLLAGGLFSHLSGRVLAGEAGRLPESHRLLLRYLLHAHAGALGGWRGTVV
jgi:hypothetical protein